jgi:hypothetical protein
MIATKHSVTVEFRTAEAAAEFVLNIADFISEKPVTAYLKDGLDKSGGGVNEYIVKHRGDRPEAFEMEQLREPTEDQVRQAENVLRRVS